MPNSDNRKRRQNSASKRIRLWLPSEQLYEEHGRRRDMSSYTFAKEQQRHADSVREGDRVEEIARRLLAVLKYEEPFVTNGRELYAWLRELKNPGLWDALVAFGKARSYPERFIDWPITHVAKAVEFAREYLKGGGQGAATESRNIEESTDATDIGVNGRNVGRDIPDKRRS
jgi:hypothetical protein